MVLYNVVKKLVAGLAAVLPAGTKFQLNGASYTLASLLAQFSSYVSAYDAVQSNKHQYQVAVAQLKAATPGIRKLVAALGSYLRGQLGPSGSAQLNQLGLKSGVQRNPASALAKAQAQTNAKATKQARGIKGKQQRAQIPSAAKVTVQLLGPDGKPIQNSGSAAPQGPSSGGPGANGSSSPSGG